MATITSNTSAEATSDQSQLIRELLDFKDFMVSLLAPKTKEKHMPDIDKRYNHVLSHIGNECEIVKRLNRIEQSINQNNINTTKPKKSNVTLKSKTFLIKPADPDKNEEIGEIISKHIKDHPGICVDSVHTGNNHIKVISPDPDIQNKLTSLPFPTETSINEAKKLLPQISFVVNKDQFESEEIFITRNSLPDNNCVFIKTIEFKSFKDTQKIKVIARLSRDNRAWIANRAKVFMGGHSVPFKTDVHVKFCSNCFKAGHLSQHCKHPTNTNPPIDNTCMHCKIAKFPTINHKPKSRKCESYQLERKRILNITDWEDDDQQSEDLQSQLS